MRKSVAVLLLFALFGAVVWHFGLLRPISGPLLAQVRGRATVTERLEQYGAVARARMQFYFEEASVQYPPERIVLVGLKAERMLEVYAANEGGPLVFIRDYPLCAASGVMGPKLREGDGQVPEGIYRISFLNPNSSYHLSLRVNYPNAFDREKARAEGRSNLGGDIMIHGNCVSIGCLAMRDEQAEDLFVLAADVGIRNSKVILAPLDFRTQDMPQVKLAGLPDWTPELYEKIKAELDSLPAKSGENTE